MSEHIFLIEVTEENDIRNLQFTSEGNKEEIIEALAVLMEKEEAIREVVFTSIKIFMQNKMKNDLNFNLN